jgi:hypothetical protein
LAAASLLAGTGIARSAPVGWEPAAMFDMGARRRTFNDQQRTTSREAEEQKRVRSTMRNHENLASLLQKDLKGGEFGALELRWKKERSPRTGLEAPGAPC